MDFDADGRTDVLSGSYSPGHLYLFRRTEEGFAKGEILQDKDGEPIQVGSAAAPFAYDCDDDGDLDLLVGTIDGRVWFVPNEGSRQEPAYGEGQAVEVEGQAIRAPGGDAGPHVADWDSDGLPDLLVGCGSGEILWYRNVGRQGHPVLQAAVTLVGPASRNTPERAEDEPAEPPGGPGRRTKLCAADFNGDGRLDLLVGDFCLARIKLPDLSDEQKAAREQAQAKWRELLAEYAKLNKAPEDETDQQRVERETKRSEVMKQMMESRSEMLKYRTYRYEYHGWVWLLERTNAEKEPPEEGPRPQ